MVSKKFCKLFFGFDRMHQEEKLYFRKKMVLGTNDVIASSKNIFEPLVPINQNPAIKFAMSLEGIIDRAPEYAPHMDQTLEKSRDSVRNFIKTASQLFGKISNNLESV